ncbi:hypothetical protein GEMRC1_013514 [Eukaryota sp. GEM-RC1]
MSNLFIKGVTDSVSLKRPLYILNRSPRAKNYFIAVCILNIIMILSFIVITAAINPSSTIKLLFIKTCFMFLSLAIGAQLQKIIASAAIAEISLQPRPSSQDFENPMFNTVFRVLSIIGYSIQSTLLSFIPFGFIFDIVFTSLQTSLYSFESQLMYQGLTFSQSCHVIENNWIYFLGFGLPLAVLRLILPSFLSMFAFPLFLPLLLLTAATAKPTSEGTPPPDTISLNVFTFPFKLSTWVLRQYSSVIAKSD